MYSMNAPYTITTSSSIPQTISYNAANIGGVTLGGAGGIGQ